MIRGGNGPEILLVHGGASPGATWGALAPLGARWTLASVHRRGYAPSPEPLDGRQDFDVARVRGEPQHQKSKSKQGRRRQNRQTGMLRQQRP